MKHSSGLPASFFIMVSPVLHSHISRARIVNASLASKDRLHLCHSFATLHQTYHWDITHHCGVQTIIKEVADISYAPEETVSSSPRLTSRQTVAAVAPALRQASKPSTPLGRHGGLERGVNLTEDTDAASVAAQRARTGAAEGRRRSPGCRGAERQNKTRGSVAFSVRLPECDR